MEGRENCNRDQTDAVGDDVEYEIIGTEGDHRYALPIQAGEIVAENLRGAAGVGVFGRKEDTGVNNQAQLDQVTSRAVQQLCRVMGLLPGPLPD